MAGEKRFCTKCGKTMAEIEFYTSKNIEKYPPDGKLNICKKCLTMHVDNWDPETYKWILEEIDVPYIKHEWDALLEKYAKEDPKKLTGLTILGRYLAKMKLKQWNKYSWADTERLNEEKLQEQVKAMKARGLSGDEIDKALAADNVPKRPEGMIEEAEPPQFYDPSEEEDDFSDKLTEDDKIRLRLKWGRGYRPEEWVRLEQLYNDMMGSYDIQGAGTKDTLIMICKTSLKSNQLLDAGDVDGAQKMIKMYDSLMKSAKLTAAQNKVESNEFVDSIGEIVAVCEKEGFIPRYYTDGPMDKVDKVLQDLQHYTSTLIMEESNLGNMLDASLRAIEEDREKESKVNLEDGEEEENDDELFDYEGTKMLEDEDYVEFNEMIEEEKEREKELLEEEE